MSSAAERLDRFLGLCDARLQSSRLPAILLFLGALALKLLYVVSTSDALYVLVPIMDSEMYMTSAERIRAGELVQERAFFMGPLYPYVLAMVMGVFGKSFLAIRIMQATAGAATVLLTYLTGRCVVRPSIAFAAGILLMFYGTMTFYEGQFLMMWLGTLLNMTALFVLLRWQGSAGFARFIVAGVCIGLSSLARANIFVMVPVIAAWIALLATGTQRGLRTALFVGAALMTILPATLHNLAASKEFIPITSNAGFNFYIGNSADATGVFYPPKNINLVSDESARKHVERIVGRRLTDGEASRWWFDEAVTFIRENPAQAARLTLRKAAMYINGYEVPQIEAYEVARQREWPLKLLFVNFWFILVLGLIGMGALLRRWKELFLLYGYALAFSATIVVFFITARYRAQIAPVLCIFAAYGMLHTVPHMVLGLRRKIAPAVAFLVIIVATRPSLFALPAEDVVWRSYTHEARRLSQLGKYTEAIDAANKAVEIHPKQPDSYLQRAVIHQERGKLFETIGDYSKALDLNPDMPSVQYDLGQTLRRVKMYEPALEAYSKAIELNPQMIEAYNNLGVTYREMRRYSDAVAAFSKVIEMDSTYTKAYNNLGATLAEAGRPERAVPVFKRAIAVDPGYPGTYRNLAMAYAQLGDVQQAHDAMNVYLQFRPGDRKAAEVRDRLKFVIEADTTGAYSRQPQSEQ